jgi:hypothetical protein
MNQKEFENLQEGDIVEDRRARRCFVMSRDGNFFTGVEMNSITDQNGYLWMFADMSELHQPGPASTLKLGASVTHKLAGPAAQNYKVSLVFPGLAIVMRKVIIKDPGEWRLVSTDSTERVRPMGPGRESDSGGGTLRNRLIA